MRKNRVERNDRGLLVSLWLLALVLVAHPAFPQERLESLRPQEFGVSQEIIHNIGPLDFQTTSSRTVVERSGLSVQCTTGEDGNCVLGAAVRLPSGVRITSVKVFYFDDIPGVEPQFGLYRVSPTAEFDIFAVAAGPVFSGGYTSMELPVDPTFATVDNESYHYGLGVILQNGSPVPSQQHLLVRVAIRYVRQVSLAPASATFDDVSTDHPYFRHIEALFDSGITSGCNASPPMFCAHRPISRGEMAVFLAKALGLHWQ